MGCGFLIAGLHNRSHLLKDDGSWHAFSFPITAAQYPVDIAADPYGYVWIVLDPAKGGGMLAFNRETNKYKYITNAAGAGNCRTPRYVLLL